MILIGIVGVLNPLGRKMLEVLQNYSSYKVIWTVDENFPHNDSQKSQFKNVDDVLFNGLMPSLVLDFGSYSYSDVYQRVKTYRKYGVAAIMQGVLPEDEITFLNNFGRESAITRTCAPVVIEPDFSVVKT